MAENTTLVTELEPIIKKFIQLRAYIDAEREKLKIAMAEYEKGKTFLGNYLAATLTQSRLNGVAAPSGTAFTTSKVEYKVVDKSAFLRWLLSQNDPNIWELVKLQPDAKEIDAWAGRRFDDYCEYVKTAGDQVIYRFEDFLPPGLNRTSTVFIKVRKKGDVSDDD
jgi:hypothetical protein